MVRPEFCAALEQHAPDATDYLGSPRTSGPLSCCIMSKSSSTTSSQRNAALLLGRPLTMVLRPTRNFAATTLLWDSRSTPKRRPLTHCMQLHNRVAGGGRLFDWCPSGMACKQPTGGGRGCIVVAWTSVRLVGCARLPATRTLHLVLGRFQIFGINAALRMGRQRQRGRGSSLGVDSVVGVSS